MIIDSIKLRKKREEKKLTQPVLAESIGLSQQRICEWETKDSNVKLEHVLKLCELLQIDLNDISKDGTTVKILNGYNQSKDNNINQVVENGINSESNLQKELFESLKQQNENLFVQVQNQNKIIDAFNKHSNFLEDIILWMKGKLKE